jgi:PPM family protein phosphatase
MTDLYVLESAAASDRGRRPVNQDSLLHRSQPGPDGRATGLYAVCDGFGPGTAGKQASTLAAQAVDYYLGGLVSSDEPASPANGRNGSQPDVAQQIARAVTEANRAVWRQAQALDPDSGRMGTTLTLALVAQGQAYIANAGDSRTYLWRNGRLTRLTEDHSLPGQLEAKGLISEQQMLAHPYLNVLDRALGTRPEVAFDLFIWPVTTGDKLLLCSDGLWKAFDDPVHLSDLLTASSPPAALCRSLLAAAKKCDASDNISAVLAEVLPVAAEAERQEAAVSREMA